MVLQSGGLCMTYGDRYGGAQPTWHTLSPRPVSHSTTQHRERWGDPHHHGCGRGPAPPGVPRGC